MSNIGKKLKEFGLKKFKGITPFAKALGVKREQLYPYFNNKTIPGGGMLKKLKDMGCDINWLLADDEGPPAVKEPSAEYKIKQLESAKKKLETENADLRAQIGHITAAVQAAGKIAEIKKKRK